MLILATVDEMEHGDAKGRENKERGRMERSGRDKEERGEIKGRKRKARHG